MGPLPWRTGTMVWQHLLLRHDGHSYTCQTWQRRAVKILWSPPIGNLVNTDMKNQGFETFPLTWAKRYRWEWMEPQQRACSVRSSLHCLIHWEKLNIEAILHEIILIKCLVEYNMLYPTLSYRSFGFYFLMKISETGLIISFLELKFGEESKISNIITYRPEL